ncbi:VOC family protein [Nocardia sp. NPDC046763]|uniref:VOC family protein n=1 Tax=Nocardia sp. NPDC046763 TaxID=3155256 RepID=UPI0033E70316
MDRFDRIVLNCRDVAATAAWYERVLGMRVETSGESTFKATCFGHQHSIAPVSALTNPTCSLNAPISG